MPPLAQAIGPADLYRYVFETAPIALWLEDFSALRPLLDDLHSSGVTDLRAAMRSNPALLETAIGCIQVVAANATAVALVGANSAEDLIGPLPVEILMGDAPDSIISQVEAVWNRVSRLELELEGNQFGGNRIDCILHWTSPVVEGHRDLTRVVVAITDITKRREEERAIRNLYADLESSHKALEEAHRELGHTQAKLLQAQRLESIGALAAGIAHEINTPIQYIGDNTRFASEAFVAAHKARDSALELRKAAATAGLSEAVARFDATLQETDVAASWSEIPTALKETLEGVDRVASIVRALGDFAHPGALDLSPVDLTHTIESTLTVSRNEWKYVAEVATDFDPTLTNVPALRGPFNQALLNIIVNAAHAIEASSGSSPHASDKGQITITTREVEGWAEIRIADNGSGIPPEAQSRVYDPFFTTKDIGKGTGQGLAIAHNVICDQHRGTLTFETDSSGTTFFIRIPRHGVEVVAA